MAIQALQHNPECICDFRTWQCMTFLSGGRCGGQVEECALGWLPMDKLGQTGDQHAPQPALALPAMPVLLHCLLIISLHTQAALDESSGISCALQGRQDVQQMLTSSLCKSCLL